MGRLFDAVSALIGIRQVATYEGQAAIELEAAVDPYETGCYEFSFSEGVITIHQLIEGIIRDWRSGRSNALISAKFHNTIARIALEICQSLRVKEGITTVALSGGVWQNRTLFARTVYNLEANGFLVLRHHQVPVNDGSIALGQAMVAAQVSL